MTVMRNGTLVENESPIFNFDATFKEIVLYERQPFQNLIRAIRLTANCESVFLNPIPENLDTDYLKYAAETRDYEEMEMYL